MVSREDREGRREEGKEDRNTAIQGKQRTRNIRNTEYRLNKNSSCLICPSIYMPVYLFLLSFCPWPLSFLFIKGRNESFLWNQLWNELRCDCRGEMNEYVYKDRCHLLHLSLATDPRTWGNIYTLICTSASNEKLTPHKTNTHSIRRWKNILRKMRGYLQREIKDILKELWCSLNNYLVHNYWPEIFPLTFNPSIYMEHLPQTLAIYFNEALQLLTDLADVWVVWKCMCTVPILPLIR